MAIETAPRRASGDATTRVQPLLDAFVAIATEGHEASILERAAGLARATTGAAYGVAALATDGRVVTFAQEGMTSHELSSATRAPAGQALVRTVIADCRTPRVEDQATGRGSVEGRFGDLSIGAFLGVPVALDGETLGAIYVGRRPGRGSFDEDDERFLDTLARQAAVAIRSARAQAGGAPTTPPPGVDPAAATAEVAAGAESSARAIERILATAREQLSLDVSFLSEWVDGKQVFRGLEGDAESFGLHQDEGLPLADSYCIRVVSGELPAVIPDASQNLVAAGLAVTAAAGIGAYVGVPVTFTDGRMYGMLCCLSHAPDPSLRARDTKFLHVLARLLAEQLEERDRGASRKRDEVARIRAALEAGDPAIVVQPIVDLRSRRTVGYEALSRFASEPRRTPDVWFADAAAAGIGIELELIAARRAIEVLADLPADAYLAINLSPDAILADGFRDLLAHVDPARLVVEITEHAQVHDYGPLVVALAHFRARGVRLSIDDAGAGFASFRHILRLAPDIIKLDISLTSQIDHDPAERAVARAIVALGREFGTTIVAEGIETATQLAALRSLSVPCGQGYFLGRPAPPSRITAHPDPIAASGERASLIQVPHRRGRSASPALAGHGAR